LRFGAVRAVNSKVLLSEFLPVVIYGGSCSPVRFAVEHETMINKDSAPHKPTAQDHLDRLIVSVAVSNDPMQFASDPHAEVLVL